LTSLLVVPHDIGAVEARLIRNDKDLESFLQDRKLTYDKQKNIAVNEKGDRVYSVISLNKKDKAYALIRGKDHVTPSKVHRFNSIKELTKFAGQVKGKFLTNSKTHRDDRRFIVNEENRKTWKIFSYDNDRHLEDKTFLKNKRAVMAGFDDFDEVTKTK